MTESVNPQSLREVLRLLEEGPAIKAAAIASGLGLAPATVTAALKEAVMMGKAERLSSGATVWHAYAPEKRPEGSRAGLSAVERRADLVAWIKAAEVIPSVSEIAGCYGVNRNVVTADLRMLEAGGVITRDRSRHFAHAWKINRKAEWREPRADHARSTTPWTAP